MRVYLDAVRYTLIALFYAMPEMAYPGLHYCPMRSRITSEASVMPKMAVMCARVPFTRFVGADATPPLQEVGRISLPQIPLCV